MALDTLILNGTSLSDTTVFGLEAIDLTPPPKKPEWAQGSDSDGSALIRTPLFENRTITASIRITPQATMDLVLEKLGILVDLLQEAEKDPEGIPLEWSPATATKKITFYVLTGAVTAIPMVNEGQGVGWYAKAPLVTIALTCKPFGYGPEVEAAAVKSIETGLSIVVLTAPSVAGDVPAEGRLVIEDTAGVGRRFVEWGLENRYYSAGTKLVLDSEDMIPVGGVQSTALNASGAYKRAGATKGTIATALFVQPTVCCNTGALAHVGTFRVKARAQAMLGSESEAANVHLRLAYQDGEGPFRGNAWQTPVLGGEFVEIDLGVVTVTQAQIGNQKWLGRIEAYSENIAGSDTLHIDYLTLIPIAEGYGKARAISSSAPGLLAGFDNATTGTLSGSLNARTPALGAAWATSGAATDWTVAAKEITREVKTDSEPRWGVLGSAQGNSRIIGKGFIQDTKLGLSLGLLLRWVNKENYAFLSLETTGGRLRLGVKVAGVTSILQEAGSAYLTPHASIELSFAATLDGALTGKATIDGAEVPMSASSAAVATGGVLASGKGGIFEQSSGNNKERKWTYISIEQLPEIPYCIQPSRVMQIRSDSTVNIDSTGTYYGSVGEYRGSRFYVPQDGSANRTSRIIVKADRNDLEEAGQQTIADAFTARAFVTPRYHVIPR